MGVFDIGSMQSAASVVAGSLSPKHTAAQGLSMPALRANAASSPSGTGSTSAATANGSGITSGDFLALLVTELKNQDPTQPTDPNAYITQLVGVNSLQQLISINKGIDTINKPVTPAVPAV